MLITSVLQKLHQKIHLSVKITVPFVLILVLSISTIGLIFYSQSKVTVISLIETRLQSETKKITEKITLLKYSLASNPKQYGKRFVYELRQQQAGFAQEGLTIDQFLVRKGTFEPIDKVTKHKISFSPDIAKKIQHTTNGVIHVPQNGATYTLAYSFSPEENFNYVIVVNQDQYLAPLENIANIIFIAVSTSIVLSLLFGWFVVRSITSPFQVLVKGMKKVSNGDLTERTELQKEGPELTWIAVSFNFMIEQMSAMIKEIKKMVEELNNGGYEISTSADEAIERSAELFNHIQIVNDGVEQTAVSTEKASLLFHDMKTEIESLCTKIYSVVQSSEYMKNTAEDGKQNILDMTEMMKDFSKIMHELEERMVTLDHHSHSIGQIVDMISRIAKQTKLLALNASIEAARAGQLGRGFTVVAGEVGNLADDSEKAAVKIAELIKAVQNDTRQVSAQAKNATNYLQETQKRIESTESAFLHLTNAVIETNDQMNEVSTGLSHVSQGLTEVDRTFDTFVAVSQQTLSSTSLMLQASKQQLDAIEKSKHLSDQLITLSNGLEEMSNRFTVA